MKDGVTASMASQGRLSEDQGCANAQHIQVAAAFGHATSSSEASTSSSTAVKVNSTPPSISKIRSVSLEKSPLAKVREDSMDKKS